MTRNILIKGEGKGERKGEETSPLRAAAPVTLRVPEFKRVILSLVGRGRMENRMIADESIQKQRNER